MPRSIRPAHGALIALLCLSAHAEIGSARLTTFRSGDDDAAILARVNRELGTRLTTRDFRIIETTPLQGMEFRLGVQVRANQPVQGTALRIWRTANRRGYLLVEARLERPSARNRFHRLNKFAEGMLSPVYLASPVALEQQQQAVRAVLAAHGDAGAVLAHEDSWREADFRRVFTAVGTSGTHRVHFSHERQRVVEHDYVPFATAELPPVRARGYSVYERPWMGGNSAVLPPEDLELRHLSDSVRSFTQDPFAAVTSRVYPFDPVGLTTWSGEEVDNTIQRLENAFGPGQRNHHGALQLSGRYVDVTVHPAAVAAWEAAGTPVPVLYADALDFGQEGRNLVLRTRRRLPPLSSEALAADPVVDPAHNSAVYARAATDQVQVYWAVNEIMERLQGLGLTDPSISTDKFHAVLYNPDRTYRDNAFYFQGTINFTTYSPGNANMARDNTIIWHEIGHGMIERLMGRDLALAAGKGFHEGMADFLAELTLQASVGNRDFPGRSGQRIHNRSLFNIANEAHDDGEAYAGFMKHMLDAAMARWGQARGLAKTADLVFLAMRFSRAHPALDEQAWVQNLLFADGLGSRLRARNEFSALVSAALVGRNFRADRQGAASMAVQVGELRLERDGMGSHMRPVRLRFGEEQRFSVRVSVQDGSEHRFTYPLTLKIRPGRGAAGPVDWIGEDQGTRSATINGPGEEVVVDGMGVTGQCDWLNEDRETSCKESLLIDIHEPGQVKPSGRQRVFYHVSERGSAPFF